MRIKIIQIGEIKIAEVESENIIIKNIGNALDIMGNCSYQDSHKIILHEKNIIPDFFDLKTKLAGEILQKFSTYRVQLAIVGDYTKYTSKSLNDFIFESNKLGQIIFASSVEEAKEKLLKK